MVVSGIWPPAFTPYSLSSDVLMFALLFYAELWSKQVSDLTEVEHKTNTCVFVKRNNRNKHIKLLQKRQKKSRDERKRGEDLREGTQRETEIKQDKHKVWHTEEG